MQARGESLLSKSTTGVLWLGGGQASGLVLQIAVRLVLARLLAPDDFGLVAMAVVFTGFCSLLTDLGLGQALVQRKEIDEEHKSTAFWAAGLIGVTLCGLFIVSAPLVGVFYGNQAVVPVVRALGFTFVLGFPESVFSYLLERRLSFRLIGLRRLLGVVLGGSAGIALALGGFGVWALVAEQLIRSAAGSILYFASSDWRPKLLFSRAALLEMWSYSRSIVGARVVNFFNRNLDNLLIGRFLGATPLGLYSVAYQGVLMPLQQIARPIASVGFPAFATIQDDIPRCRSAYLSALRISLLVATPVPVLVIFLSPTAVPLLLGEQWALAVLPLQILSVVALFQIGMSLSPPLFLALGRADLSLKWTLIALAASTIGIVVGLRWGIVGVAWGYLAAVVVTSPIQFAMTGRLLQMPLTALGPIFGRMLLALLATAIAPALLLWQIDLPPFAELAAAAVVIVLGFLAFTRLLAAEAWAVLRRSAESIG